MRYEMFREIFNECANNQMRDVFIEEIETDDPRKWLETYLAGKDVQIEETHMSGGETVFDVVIANLKQRFTFTPDE